MKLLDQVRDVMCRKHYSIRTEHAYLNWIKQSILFHKKCHPKDMGEKNWIDLCDFDHLKGAKRPERLPAVMGEERICPFLEVMPGIYG